MKSLFLKFSFFLIFTNAIAQTAAIQPDGRFRIQNSFGNADFGSSTASISLPIFDLMTGTIIGYNTLYPSGPVNFYQIGTDRQGFQFDKNIISSTGKFTAIGNVFSLNFLQGGPTNNTTIIPALLITKTDGKVGIGHTVATTITAKFDLINSLNKLSLLTTSNFSVDNLNANIFRVNRDKTKAIAVSNTNYLNSGQTKELFVVMGNGATHIGEKWGSGVYKDALLSVYGQVVARSFHVTIDAASWADYVFAKNYTLMPLADVEKYYEANHHLPDVPSAKDLETNGLNIADMESILMKKIEELTLYVVKQQKEMELMKQQLKDLQK